MKNPNNAREEVRKLFTMTALSGVFGYVAHYCLTTPHLDQAYRLLGAFCAFISALCALAATLILLTWLLRSLFGMAVGGYGLLRFYFFRKILAILCGIAIWGFGFCSVYHWYRFTKPTLFIVSFVIGIVATQWPDITAAIKRLPLYQRLFVSGGNPSSGWAEAPSLRRSAQKFSSTHRPGYGYVSDGLFVGTSTRESSYWPLDIWLRDPASDCVIGCTGSGKLSDIGVRAITYGGSAVWCSPKPELADMFLARNVDQSAIFTKELALAGKDPGVNPRGISLVTIGKPRFRAYCVDPFGTSAYPDCPYTFLNDIPADNAAIAVSRAAALAQALIPIPPGVRERFFHQAAQEIVVAAILHTISRCPPELQNLPFVADFLMGIDPKTRTALPPDQSEEKHPKHLTQFDKNLNSMMANGLYGGIIAAAAARLAEAGERTAGSVKYELANSLLWLQSPAMRKHLSAGPRFSYNDLGDDRFPVSVFIVPNRVDTQSAAAFMRLHVCMSTAVFKARDRTPQIPTLMCLDEFRQYGVGAMELVQASLILRSVGVKPSIYLQDLASGIAALGEEGFNEYLSSSTKRFFGVNTIATSKAICDILGHHMLDGQMRPLADAQQIMKELAVRSNLTYVIPYGGPPVMRLHRRSFKTIKTREGLTLRGLPLNGLYDDGLSRSSRTERHS